MNMNVLMVTSMILPLVILVILLIIWYLIRQQMKQSKYQEFAKLKALLPEKTQKRDWNRFGNRLYPYLREIPLVRLLLNKLYRRLGIIHLDNEARVRAYAANYTVIILASMVSVATVALLWSDAWSTRLAIIIVSLYVCGFLTDMFIERTQLSFLRKQDKLLKANRHEYHKTHMVMESLERVAENSTDPVISAHAQKIADILSSTEAEEELHEYYEIAPNNYMKTYAGISYKVAEYGDSEEGEKSFYLEALSNIREEIHRDINRRVKLNRLLKFIVAIAVAPIFMVDPIRRWSEANFPIISNYYNSSWGTYSLILLYIIFIISYIVLRMAKRIDGDPQGVREEGKWLERILKSKLVRKIVRKLVPGEHEAAYFQAQERIKKANSRLSIEAFYLMKILFVVTVFFGTIFIQIGVKERAKHNVLYPNQAITISSSQTSSQQLLSKERYAFESLLIGEIISKNIPANEVIPYILSKIENKNFIAVDTDLNTYAQQLALRVDKYQSIYYKWYELIIAFILAAISYRVPDAYLAFKQQMRKWEMQNEVDGFNTSVMMLSNIPTVSVYEIIEWMHRDSYIFRDQLMTCLLDYESGAMDALERLKDEVHFDPLEHLVERLQEAVDRIPIKDAFDDMKIEREFAMAEREEHFEEVIERKASLAKMAGFTPLGATFILYLFIPFLYLMFQEMGNLTKITGGM